MKKKESKKKGEANNKKNVKYLIIFIATFFSCILLSLILTFCYFVYWTQATLTDREAYIYLKPGSTFEEIKEQLNKRGGILKHPKIFNLYAEYKGLNKMKIEGRYATGNHMSIAEIVNVLRNGKETPIRLKIGYINTVEEFANLLSSRLLIKKSQIIDAFRDKEICQSFGFTPETLPAMLLPQTLQLKWQSTPKEILQHFKYKYNEFWTDRRLQQAHQLGYSPTEISIIASIVEKESRVPKDWPIIARLYMNRLQKNMRLQADPTVKFALNSFNLRRILHTHLSTDSPYNTYKVNGLPPGPICFPHQEVIDSVLHAPNVPYIYMCASPDFSGTHRFSTSYEEHLINAKEYQKALDHLKIR